jgi:AraC-like DNA-binding protein
VKEVAWAVGYSHTSSFVRAFERVFHQAPGRFQRQMLNKSVFS